MKKLILLTNILVILSFSSCKKNDELITSASQRLELEGATLFQKISKIGVYSDRLVAYSTLSAEQRYAVWASKLDQAIVSGKYTFDQISALRSIRERITISIFKKGTDEREIFYTSWFPQWANNAEKIFTGEDFINLFYTMEATGLKKQTTLVVDIKDCKCARFSSKTCPTYSVGWPPSVSVSWGTCETVSWMPACTSTESGCGALWDQECDGNRCPSDSPPVE